RGAGDAGPFRGRPGAAGGSRHDHAVLHLLQQRRRDRADRRPGRPAPGGPLRAVTNAHKERPGNPKAQTHDDPNIYYVPHHSPWPFVGSITLFVTAVGVANWFNGAMWGKPVFLVGLLATLAVLFGWFGNVISESVAGRYN